MLRKNDTQDFDIIIVGGGPVGIYFAIEAFLNCKSIGRNIRIKIYEKYQVYQRHHVLRIDPASFDGMCKDIEWQQYIKQNLLGNKKSTAIISTSQIENVFLAYAEKLGIVIEKDNPIENYTSLIKAHPYARVIVGADGARSLIRKQVFGDILQVNEDLNFIAELKYHVAGAAKGVPYALIEGIKSGSHYVTEHVGREKDGKTAITLRLFIDQFTYNYMSSATAKNPWVLGDKKINDTLRKSIDEWINKRKKYYPEESAPIEPKITVTKLPVYASQTFAKVIDGVDYYIVGDAAMGLPYFRSLNNGLECAAKLANCMKITFQSTAPVESNENFLFRFFSFVSANPSSSPSLSMDAVILCPIVSYNNYMQAKVIKERIVANVKNTGINLLQISTASIDISHNASTDVSAKFKSSVINLTKISAFEPLYPDYLFSETFNEDENIDSSANTSHSVVSSSSSSSSSLALMATLPGFFGSKSQAFVDACEKIKNNKNYRESIQDEEILDLMFLLGDELINADIVIFTPVTSEAQFKLSNHIKGCFHHIYEIEKTSASIDSNKVLYINLAGEMSIHYTQNILSGYIEPIKVSVDDYLNNESVFSVNKETKQQSSLQFN